MDLGFPHVAVQKIKEVTTGGGVETAGAKKLLARALIEDGRPAEAIALLNGGGADLEERFWMARALADTGEWESALSHYEACVDDPSFEFSGDALVGKGRMLRNMGRSAEALEAMSGAVGAANEAAAIEAVEAALDLNDTARAAALLDRVEPLNPAVSTRAGFLRGKIAFLVGDHAGALGILHALKPVGPGMAVEATAIKAKALMETGWLDEAETMLEEFIAGHPNLTGLQPLFALLDSCYAGSTGASSNELTRWAASVSDTPAKMLAIYYLARFETRRSAPEAALPMLEALAATAAENPMAAETVFELAALRIRLGRPEEALGGLPAAGTGPHTDYLRGLALARIGDHGAAAAAFLGAASDPTLHEDALFNAAMCGIFESGNPGIAFERLQQEHPGARGIELVRLQSAFHMASGGKAATAEALEELAASPDSAVAAKARLALAEWKYRQLDTEGARKELLRISTAADPAREAALAVFLTDNGEAGSDERTVAAARDFLASFPAADSTTSVWMKLGEVLFRKGDYASARVELESLARKFPGSDYEESALFLAAQSAARMPVPAASEDAILLFEEVASASGVLASSARMEQAAILAAQGKPLEANVILDKILAGAPDRETRAAALVEKGKNLYRLGDKDAENYRLAIGLWKQLASEEEQDPVWRNQAMTRVGDASEKLGDAPAAIAAYYEVFKPSDAPVPEFFWFYKSGFAAARLLEEEEKWEEAIRVYELMADVEGPRALEAKNRINKLRLEHFLWEED
jgi:tetratricopeptide (TPR) repeat protein